MANRLRLRLAIDTTPVTTAPVRLRRWRAHLDRLGWRLVTWRALWFPFWFGGELPAPWLPTRRKPAPIPEAPAAREVVRAIDAIGRRVWLNMLLAAFARGLWLPFVLGSIVAVVQIVRERDWSPERFVWVWGITIPLALLLAWLLRPDRERTARMLDRTFTLRDRLTTAIEGLDVRESADRGRAPLPYLQMADAANVAIGLKGDPRFRLRLPARELSLAILAGLLMLALLFLRGVGGELPALSHEPPPRFVPAAERRTAAAPEFNANPAQRPPTVEEVEAAALRSNTTLEDLDAVAAALSGNALTQPAADAIRAGNYEAAAQLLRDVAAQAATLPPESRESLASALDEAAAATSGSSPSLSNAASQASAGLREGGRAATSGLRDLGDAIELAGEAVVPQSVLAEQMQQAQQISASQSPGADAAQAPSQPGGPQGSSNPSGQPGGEPGEPVDGSGARGADAGPGSADSSQSWPQGGDSGDFIDAPAGGGGESGGQSDFGAGMEGFGEGSEGGALDAAGMPQGGSGEEFGPGGLESGGDQSLGEASQLSGGGASSGGTDEPSQSESGPAGAGMSGEIDADPDPADTNLADGAVPTGAGAAATVDPRTSIGLSDPGGSESFMLGGGGSASSLGSGAGVIVSGGDATQEAVGDAGPQSNRVPDDYRSIVENYFSRD